MFIIKEKSEVGIEVEKRVATIVQKNMEQGKITTIAVSGSSQPILLAPAFSNSTVEWNNVHFYFSDERCVGLEDPDSNYAAWNTHFFTPKSIPKGNIHTIATSFSSAAEAAELYEQELSTLPQCDGFPVFDVILLGMGPDGHTCSLFPDRPQVNENKKWVTHITDSPKPPSDRITLTLPVLNRAKHVYFIAAGKDKAPRINELKNNCATFPSALIHPIGGELLWFVDSASYN